MGRRSVRERLWVLPALVVLAGFLGYAGIAAATQDTNGPRAVAAGQPTYARFSGLRQYKPSAFYFGAHEQITSMSWSFWGKKLAQGTGTYQVNNCIPDCADGTITPTPASVFLTGRIFCGNHFLFRRMKVLFSGHRRGSGAYCPSA